MKKKLLGGLALALLLAGCGNSGDSDKEKTDDGKKTYKIGIIQQMEHPALDSAREGLEKYLKGKSDAKFEITVKNAQGDNGTADTIAKQFVSDDVDLIYSIATNASQAAVNATGGTDIPVVFNAVTDGVEAKLVTSNEKPGGNVTGVSDAAPLEKQLEMILQNSWQAMLIVFIILPTIWSFPLLPPLQIRQMQRIFRYLRLRTGR